MTLENWLTAGKLVKHQTSPEEISAMFDLIGRDLKDASAKNISLDRRFNIAYGAAFEAALALLYCHDYKPTRESHHYMTWVAMKDILDPKFHGTIKYFDDCRKKRNILDYNRAGIASREEVDEICRESEDFVACIKEIIKREYPAYF